MSEAKKDTMTRALESALDAIENSLQNSKDDLVQAMALVEEDETPKVTVAISLKLEQTGADEISCKTKVSFTKEKRVIEYDWTVSPQEELPFTGANEGRE